MKIGRQGGAPVKLKRAVSFGEKVGIVVRVLIVIGIILGLVWAQNNFVMTKDYIYTSKDLPKTFVGYKVAHVSDLHNSDIDVIGAVKRAEPNLIIVTGGYADDSGNINKSVDILNKLSKIATTLYIPGDNNGDTDPILSATLNGPILLNNSTYTVDSPSVDTDAFINKYIGKRIIKQANDGDKDAINYIDYTKTKLESDASRKLMVTGLSDDKNPLAVVDEIYSLIGTDKSVFQILGTSQTEIFKDIAKADIHVVFSGTTHGFTGIVPNYSKGMYTDSGTTMFVSSGIGNVSVINGEEHGNNRIFNFPSITVLTLSDGTIKQENPLEKLLGRLIGDVSTRFDNDAGFSEYVYSYNNATPYEDEY